MKAIIDRIVEDTAVLLIQPHEKHTFYCPIEYLPEDAKEGSVLIISMEVDHGETGDLKERVKGLIEKLKNKSP